MISSNRRIYPAIRSIMLPEIPACFLAAVLMSLTVSVALASPQELVVTEEDFEEQKVYSPYAGRAYADHVFFGDTHLQGNLQGNERDGDGGWLVATNPDRLA